MAKFNGKTIVVTGGGSGIGTACVRRLYEEGAAVIVADVCEEDAQRIAAEINDSDRIYAVAADVTDAEQVGALIAAAIDRFGPLHGLVNCAGIRGVGTVLDTDLNEWRKTVAVNLEGTFNTCQAFARAAEAAHTKAAIVNISSGAGVSAVPNRLSYVASKFGVSGMTRAMAMELGKMGIRVNAVAPGMIRTPMTQGMFQDPENVKRIKDAHPIGRAGEPEEIAAAISFLLSEDASFVTGVVLPVDGGMTTGIASH